MARTLGPYQIHSELGRGAMAIVWRAHDPVLDRDVAIKEPLLPQGVDAVSAAEFGARFVREAKAAARLNHPNIVTIHAADIYNGTPAIVMELVEGETLGQILERGPLPPQAALSFLEQLLLAVGFAHERGIVHRDIKPDNIFVTPDGRVKLADFGIASLGGDATLTQAGTIMGTPGYMAPEQITGDPVDTRADIFAIGALAYEMLTGHNPFGASEGAPTTTIMYRIVHQAPPELPPQALAGLPVDLRPVLQIALAKDRNQRFPSAGSFLAALRGQGPLPMPGAYAAQVSGPRAGTMMARAAMIKQKTMFGRPAGLAGGSAANASWLHSWLPYAVVVGIGLIVMIALLATSGGGGGGSGLAAATAGAGTSAPVGTSAPASASTPSAFLATSSAFARVTSSPVCDPDSSGNTYWPQQALDGALDTCWGNDGRYGWIQFDFSLRVHVTELRIVAGYQKFVDWDRWPVNNRLREFAVIYDDGVRETYTLGDIKGFQTVTMRATGPTTSLRLEVVDVYPATKDSRGHQWDDTCVSEIQPYGYVE